MRSAKITFTTLQHVYSLYIHIHTSFLTRRLHSLPAPYRCRRVENFSQIHKKCSCTQARQIYIQSPISGHSSSVIRWLDSARIPVLSFGAPSNQSTCSSSSFSKRSNSSREALSAPSRAVSMARLYMATASISSFRSLSTCSLSSFRR